MRKFRRKKYEGFSLVEMLLTIAIIGMVMLISSTTLTTLIKVSTVASNKIRARNETEFVLELVRRTVRNSDPSDVFVFKTDAIEGEITNGRKYNPVNGEIEDVFPNMDINTVYEPLEENVLGNEIHFRPYGYEDWICLAFFPSSEDPERGYILRTSADDLYDQHENCFTSTNYFIVLNSDYVDVNSFNVAYTVSNDNNYMIRFDIESEPVDWYLGSGAPITKTVFRQGVVSTEGLIW